MMESVSASKEASTIFSDTPTVDKGFAKKTILKLYYLADGAEAALEILEGALNAPARS